MIEINKDEIQYIPIINHIASKSDLDMLTDSFVSKDVRLDTWIRNLSNAYEHHILGLVSTTLIMHGGKLIGFYAARVGNLEVEEDEKKQLKGEAYIPSVEILYFVMHKDYEGQGIGSMTMMDLIADLIEANAYMAIRYLFCWSVDVPKTLHFYRNRGFDMMDTQQDGLRLMRFAIPDTRDIQLISEYNDDFRI